MSKAEDLLGIKYTEMNKQQRRLYLNKLKKESRKRNSDKIKEQNKRYYENKKSQFSDLQSQLAQQKAMWNELKEWLIKVTKLDKEIRCYLTMENIILEKMNVLEKGANDVED